MSDLATCARCGDSLAAGMGRDYEGLCARCLADLAVETGASARTSQAATRVNDEPAPLKDGATFRGLEIVSLLGRGGMGFVYKARQIDLDRWVAVKILSPKLAREVEFARRFNREAKALARLDHPNIVRVMDYGKEGDLFFLIMDLVDGVPLRELMRGGELAASEALRIVPQICEALEYAHSQGVVHRDIKPENILLDKQGRVRIADFGLAKMQTTESDSYSGTQTNVVMGTPDYMAPEQREGMGKVDHRADIYSLGVVFYEMLTGEIPMGKFQPPSQRVQVDVRLDQVVLKALERFPERRYQSAGDVNTHLSKISGPFVGASVPKKSFIGPKEVIIMLSLLTLFAVAGWSLFSVGPAEPSHVEVVQEEQSDEQSDTGETKRKYEIEIEAKVKQIKTRIRTLKKERRQDEAIELSNKLANVLRFSATGIVKEWKKDEPEVHVVGVHEGKSDTDQVAHVKVTYTDRPIVLVLCSYNSVWWTVEAEEGVQIQKILLGGYHHQGIEKRPEGVPVEKYVHDDGSKDHFQAYSKTDDSYTQMVSRVERLAKMPISTFLGSYGYSGEPFVIGKKNFEWRDQKTLFLLDQLDAEASQESAGKGAGTIKAIQYKALWQGSGHGGRRITSASFGDFSPLGPKSSYLKPIKKPVMHIAHDPKTGVTYGLTTHDLVKIDLKNGEVEEFKVELRKDLPRLSWPSGLAMDTKRKRLLLLNNNGGAAESYLYGYDLKKDEWVNLAGMGRHPKLICLSYAQEEDKLYGIYGTNEEGGTIASLHRFSPTGATLNEITLSKPIRVAEGSRVAGIQLISINKKKMVLMVGPLISANDGKSYETRAYLINPQNGKILYSGVQKPE